MIENINADKIESFKTSISNDQLGNVTVEVVCDKTDIAVYVSGDTNIFKTGCFVDSEYINDDLIHRFCLEIVDGDSLNIYDNEFAEKVIETQNESLCNYDIKDLSDKLAARRVAYETDIEQLYSCEKKEEFLKTYLEKRYVDKYGIETKVKKNI